MRLVTIQKSRHPMLKIIKALYKQLSDLYVFIDNPLELLKPEVPALAKEPATKLVRMVFLIRELQEVTNELESILEEALSTYLRERYITVEEGYEIKGMINWLQTIKSLSELKPPAYYIITHVPYTIEYRLLKKTLITILMLNYRARRIIDALYGNVVKQIKVGRFYLAGYELLASTLRAIRRKTLRMLNEPIIKEIKLRKESLEELRYQVESLPWRPEWCDRLLDTIKRLKRLLRGLRSIQSIITHRGIGWKLYKGFPYYAFKLYELWNVVLVLKTLKGLGYKIIYANSNEFMALRNNDRIIVLYNRKPRINGILSSVASGKAKGILRNEINKELLEIIAGRPDITIIKNGKPVMIWECKFTTSIKYLTEARFKILGYLREYNALVGVLVFPLVSKMRRFEEEEEETAKLLRQAERHGGVAIELHRNTILCVVPLNPLNKNVNEVMLKLFSIAHLA